MPLPILHVGIWGGRVNNLAAVVSAFGAATKRKLASKAASGAPEDQLRAPLEALVADLAGLTGLPSKAVTLVGESTLAHLSTRPDYAVSVNNVLVGFVEVKAPGKGADPRRYRDEHDKEQWEKLKTLPNLLYTDGNAFSLWQNGELQGSVIAPRRRCRDLRREPSRRRRLCSPFRHFLRWEPIPPQERQGAGRRSARDFCRLLRDEVTEQLARDNPGLTALATDWRNLLFPEANDEQFADGYAQAVTFGLLMARSSNIGLAQGPGPGRQASSARPTRSSAPPCAC